jgi:hypothetical protein
VTADGSYSWNFSRHLWLKAFAIFHSYLEPAVWGSHKSFGASSNALVATVVALFFQTERSFLLVSVYDAVCVVKKKLISFPQPDLQSLDTRPSIVAFDGLEIFVAMAIRCSFSVTDFE